MASFGGYHLLGHLTVPHVCLVATRVPVAVIYWSWHVDLTRFTCMLYISRQHSAMAVN